MENLEFGRQARLFVYGPNPIVEGTVRDCVSFWHRNLASTSQTLARLRVQYHSGAYWLHAEDLQELVPDSD